MKTHSLLVATLFLALAACGDSDPSTPGSDGGVADGATIADGASGGGDGSASGDGSTSSGDGSISGDGSVGGDGAASADGGVANAAGKHLHKLTVDGVEREMIVYVPKKAVGQRAPVVFMFHGTSGDGEKFYNISGWRQKADATGLIAVFPSALTYCLKEDDNNDGVFSFSEHKVTTKWDAGKLGDPKVMPLCTAAELARLPAQKRARADHKLYDDLVFFKAMLAELAARYTVDTKRVYASGFSNGAGMVGRLVVQASDLVAAAAMAGGGLAASFAGQKPARAISVVQSVGEIDSRFTSALGVTALPLTQSALTDVPALGGFADRVRTTLSLDSTSAYRSATVAGRTLARFDYTRSTIGASNSFSFVIVQGLGHQYANGKNHPVVMADLLWKVFQTQSLP